MLFGLRSLPFRSAESKIRAAIAHPSAVSSSRSSEPIAFTAPLAIAPSISGRTAFISSNPAVAVIMISFVRGDHRRTAKQPGPRPPVLWWPQNGRLRIHGGDRALTFCSQRHNPLVLYYITIKPGIKARGMALVFQCPCHLSFMTAERSLYVFITVFRALLSAETQK